MRLLVFIFCFLFSLFATAKVDLPRNLSSADRHRAVQVLGYGSAPKLISSPYPLGGYKGVEVAVSTEIISLKELAKLGSGSNNDGRMTFNTLSLGKGLFYNVDGYVYFTPFNQNGDVQTYGAQLKWAFYEMKGLPVAFSFMVYGGGANFSNVLDVATLGGDFIVTLTTDLFSVYGGLGNVRAIGKFVGGPAGLTDSATEVTEDIANGHTFLGIHFQYSQFFVAGQVDIYSDTFYGIKVGMRF